jgi:ribosomal-protein-serine acetyltransferase
LFFIAQALILPIGFDLTMWSMFSAILLPGVELRLVEERHATALFAAVDRNRGYLREWMPWVDATRTVDDILAFIRRSMEQFAANNGFAATVWADGSIAGVIGLHKIDWLNRKAEMGYWLAREFQGRGIATAAARALTGHALVELELNRMEIHCAVNNTRSSAIPKRLGFTFEGTLRQAELNVDGRYLDLEVYSMLRREFRR